MQQPGTYDSLWPVFSSHQSVKIKNFWDKTKKKVPVDPAESPQMTDMFYRIGKAKKKAKSYFYMY